jgi:diadenylate cyclase
MRYFITEFWRGLTLREGMTAAVDILVVAYIIYRVLRLLKGTRAAQMLTGLGLVGSGLFAAKFFELTTLSWLLDNLLNYSIIFLIVIFQHDIRRGLMRVGQNLFGSARQYEETFVFEEVIKAVEQLGRSRVGALIVFEREANLEEFFGEPGVVLDARVTKELLMALFLPEPDNTMHDGAVVIRNLRVHRAGAVLPLSANPKLDKELGTRHRAAVGITEESDAVVVVVSEERGTLSLCFGGNIARDLDTATLRKALLGLFQKPKPKRARRGTGGTVKTARRTGPDSETQRIPVLPIEGMPSQTVTQPMEIIGSPPTESSSSPTARPPSSSPSSSPSRLKS